MRCLYLVNAMLQQQLVPAVRKFLFPQSTSFLLTGSFLTHSSLSSYVLQSQFDLAVDVAEFLSCFQTEKQQEESGYKVTLNEGKTQLLS